MILKWDILYNEKPTSGLDTLNTVWWQHFVELL